MNIFSLWHHLLQVFVTPSKSFPLSLLNSHVIAYMNSYNPKLYWIYYFHPLQVVQSQLLLLSVISGITPDLTQIFLHIH